MERALQQVDSILFVHMEDVVGTGPEEHLMSDLENMKTSLYLTDAVVLRNEGDTVNFGSLGITKTSRRFEVEEQYRARGISVESVPVGKLEPAAMLRNEGDTVNFGSLGITKTSRRFEVEEQYRARGISVESVPVGKLEPAANPSRRKTPVDCHDFFNFRTVVGTLIFTDGTMETRHAVLDSTTIHTNSEPNN